MAALSTETLYAVLTISFKHEGATVVFENETKEIKEFDTQAEARAFMINEGFRRGSSTPSTNLRSDTLYWKVVE